MVLTIVDLLEAAHYLNLPDEFAAIIFVKGEVLNVFNGDLLASYFTRGADHGSISSATDLPRELIMRQYIGPNRREIEFFEDTGVLGHKRKLAIFGVFG